MRTIDTERGIAYECVHHSNYFITKSGKLFSIYIKGAHGKTDTTKPHEVAYSEDKDGYYRVVLSDNSNKKYIKIHTLVVEQFIGDVDINCFVVNHKDGNKHNNNIDNLEIVTVKENNIHAHVHGLCFYDVPVDVVYNNNIYHFFSMTECSKTFHCLSRDYLDRLRHGIVTSRSVEFRRESSDRCGKISAYFNGDLIGVYDTMNQAGEAFGLKKGSVSGKINIETCATQLNRYHVTFPNVSTNESVA